MSSKSTVSLGFAIAIAVVPAAMGAVFTNGPQADPEDGSPNWSAARNVVESRTYEQLLQTSPRFRMRRMRTECGPVTDPQLHAQCIASFGQAEPFVGSSLSRPAYPNR